VAAPRPHDKGGRTLKKVILGGLAALLLVAPAADAKAFRATVVKRNLATRTVVAATRAGTLKVLHHRRDRVGTILRINGTHVKAVGHARRVKVQGVVVRHTARTVTLSAGRATVRIRVRHARLLGRRHGHQLGNGLRISAKISNGSLTETNEVEDDDVDGAELKGTLTCTPKSDPGTCDQVDTLKIDIGTAGAPNLIPVEFDAATFPDTLLDPLVGQQVEARVNLGPSAIDPQAVVLTLQAIESEGLCQAQDDQGDDANDDGPGHDVTSRDHGDGCEDDD
jgi:hypothetical protein